MKDELHHGEIITADKINGSVRPGKCYVYNHHGVKKIHRLVRIRGEKVFFLGDNILRYETATLDDITGELTSDTGRFYEYCISIINTLFFNIIIFLPSLNRFRSFLISTIVKIGKKRNTKNEKKI